MTTVDYNSEEVRAALAAIADAHHGVLNGRDIVEAARDAQHVLHRFFEWDDPTASEAYRLVQASALIRRVRLSIVRSADGTRDTVDHDDATVSESAVHAIGAGWV